MRLRWEKWVKVSRLTKTDRNHHILRRKRLWRTRQQRYMQTLENQTRTFLVCIAVDLNFQLLVDTWKISNCEETFLTKGAIFVCLRQGHWIGECTSYKNRRHCGNKHHQSICDHESNTANGITPKPAVKEKLGRMALQRLKADRKCYFRQRRPLHIRMEKRKEYQCLVWFDSGSQRSYIS